MKTTKPKNIELLAPAGDIESFDSAIANGADAVYLGLGSFNARIKAQNFNEQNIFECVKRAHFFGVKVYVTLNTLVLDSEFKELIQAVEVAVSAKVDAFIVQDLGVCYALKKVFPNIVLHASTQMGIHNLYGAKVAEKIGITRIVLARETKVEDIKTISEQTNLELEFFVHGALCVAFSGNCYLSSFDYGASGNRGLCRQPCRMKYLAEQENSTNQKLKNEQGYMFSARDLCLIDTLKELIDAGICSFKIEGRLRRAGYVAEAVDCYRTALDSILTENANKAEKANQVATANQIENANQVKNANKAEKNRLFKVFNRGSFLSRAYLDSNVPDNVVNKASQNHQGVQVGKIIDVKPFKDIFEITLTSKHAIATGDGLKLFENGVECASLGVGSFKQIGNDTYTIFTKTKAKIGQTANLILDSKTESIAKERKRTVGVKFFVVAKATKNLAITTQSGNVKVELTSDFVCESATNKATTKAEIFEQVAKVSDSGFEVISIDIETDGVFLPKSVLNKLRRESLDLLYEKIVESNEKHIDVKACEKGIEKLQNLDMQNSTIQNFVNDTDYEKVETEYQKKTNNDDKANNLQNKIKCHTKTNSDDEKGDLLNKTLYFLYDKLDIDNIDIVQSDDIIFAIAPSDYNASNIIEIVSSLRLKGANCKVALVLPIIAIGLDLLHLEKMLASLKVEQIDFDCLVSNNVYGLHFASLGYKIIAGFGHNTTNVFATKELFELGACAVVPSVELENLAFVKADNGKRLMPRVELENDNFVKLNKKCGVVSVLPVLEMKNFRLPLMTFAHCPSKTINANSCKNCNYNEITYSINNYQYKTRKIKIAQCYFELLKK